LVRQLLALVASLVGAMFVGLTGYALFDASLAEGPDGSRVRPRLGWLVNPLADALGRASFDLPVVLRGHAEIPPACIVYIDEGAARALNRRLDPWDRGLHAQLIRRLTRQGARAVLFDVVFSEPWPDPAVDQELADAMRENGHVFLGAALEIDEGIGARQERTVPPIAVLRQAAAGWGLLVFRPVDTDYEVRRLYAGTETVPTATWVTAKALGAPLADGAAERAKVRWMNYYARAEQFPSISFDRALADDGTSDFFRDRIVIVGGRSTLGGLRLGKDEFRNPYSLLGAPFLKGPEVHLTALLNLLQREWVSRLNDRAELALVLGIGLLLGGGLPWLRPHAAALLAAASIAAIAGLAVWLFTQRFIWWAWCIPAFAQIPVALVWAVGARYFVEVRRRNALRDAFAHYLSPQMADRIADADFDLSLGGSVIEATVMFTDLENFAPLSEQLENPQLISDVLTTYFTRTTGHILESDGTILKYLGDSVEAVWGAPLPDPNHAQKATLAAWRLYAAGSMVVRGHPLRTRVGVNTGPMLAGNLGSAQRFDYAVTGDAVNFASRLEGMNKFLGTGVLISNTVQERLGDTFVTRCVGEFRVVGKKIPRVIFEVLGPSDGFVPQPWIDRFGVGLAEFRAGNLDAAEAAMNAAIAFRGEDGPSRFYLKEIAARRLGGMPPDWAGIVELSGK
jgi:adenylate cyclase